MNSDEIMRLADAYASQLSRSGEGRIADEARAALEAAVLAQGEPTATDASACVTCIDKKVSSLRREFGDPIYEAKQEPVAWMSRTGHGTYFRESLSPELEALEFGGSKMWTPLYTHPAPVNTALQTITDFDQMREATEHLARRIKELEDNNKALSKVAKDGIKRHRERIKELEAELLEQARVNGMGGEREAALMAKVERLEQALEVALEALHCVGSPLYVREINKIGEAMKLLKEVRRDPT